MKEFVVYLSYEEGPGGTILPTLWDSPSFGRVKAIWREDESGHISLETVE
jgi:hypothetical protein